MQASPAAYALIREFEGFRPDCYLCPAGIPTIGYGHTGPETKLGIPNISESEAEALLKQDLAQYEAGVRALLKVSVTQSQFDALVSFAYNLGVQSLASSTMLLMINHGQFSLAARQFGKWVHAKDPKTNQVVTLPGLVRRREAEMNLFLS